VPEPRREALLILDAAAVNDVLPVLRNSATVTQVVPPHLALVSAFDAEALRKLPGVRFVLTDDIPEQAREDLEPAEKLFVDAWEARSQPKRERPGNGLAWDAPGFLPPDPPRPR
jgi:hypothetical protein